MGRFPIWRLSLILLAWLLVRVAGDEPFVGVPTRGSAPLRVQFTDTSPGNPTSWLWYFGDEDFAAAGWLEFEPQGLTPGSTFGCATALADGSILLTGGYKFEHGVGSPTNRVLRSTDEGATWHPVADQVPWAPRAEHCCVTLADGTVVLLGGELGTSGPLVSDVWRSGDGGATWSQVSGHTAALYRRSGHACLPLPDGSLLVIGGRKDGEASHDVWRTADQGATWTQVRAAAGWAKRDGHACTLLPNGEIVLTGGRDGEGGRLQDVWRSADQGATWTFVGSVAPWSARWGHLCLALPDGGMVLAGGETGFDENGTWHSTDGGRSWRRMSGRAPWNRLGYTTSVLARDGSLLLLYATDVRQRAWRLSTVGSTEQNPLHTYERPGTYSVALCTDGPEGARSFVRERYVVVGYPLFGSARRGHGRDAVAVAPDVPEWRRDLQQVPGEEEEPDLVPGGEQPNPDSVPSEEGPAPEHAAMPNEGRPAADSVNPPIAPVKSDGEPVPHDRLPAQGGKGLPFLVAGLVLLVVWFGWRFLARRRLQERLRPTDWAVLLSAFALAVLVLAIAAQWI